MTEAGWAYESSEPFAFFDYFRVPYRTAPLHPVTPRSEMPEGTANVRPVDSSSRLFWCPARQRPGRDRFFGCFTVDGIAVAGQVVQDSAVSGALSRDGWDRAEPVHDSAGRQVASVWRRDRDGSVFLPFDPGDVMASLWRERYRDAGRPARTAARHLAVRGYYTVRPVLPRQVQLRLRRAFTHVQSRATFPRWPVEPGLHDFYNWLFRLLAQLAGRPVPWLSLWPDGRDWALVLTHDVESAAGLQQREILRGPERDRGLRSSWNIVPERYHTPDELVRELQDEGCEIGVHGLRHDGRDLGSYRMLRRRLPAMRRAAARWNAVGFRSPATHRRWEWMPEMGFAYDTSWTDTEPYEPQPGGCCTVLPFFISDLVELPITLPQDHTLFAILGEPDGRLWLEKAAHIRDRGGMALILTHPDYATDERLAGAYRSLLATFAGDPAAWYALPHEVAQWWRQRSVSTLRRSAGEWVVSGPAAERGRVLLAGRDPSAAGLPGQQPHSSTDFA